MALFVAYGHKGMEMVHVTVMKYLQDIRGIIVSL